jgi:hypothetical protein
LLRQPRRFARAERFVMAQVERKRVVQHEGTLPDGREVKRVTIVERATASPTEARAGATGQGVSPMLLISLGFAFIAMLAVWYYFFA